MTGLPSDAVEPTKLRSITEAIRCKVANITATNDVRRGFRLLQWPCPLGASKPRELSLEHEARLRPRDSTSVPWLLARLAHASAEDRIGGCVVSQHSEFSDLRVRPYPNRPRGPQSHDVYHDLGDTKTVTTSSMTVRERRTAWSGMTWAPSISDQLPLNLELPAHPLGKSGLLARLEFNWFASIPQMLEEPLGLPEGAGNPLAWLSEELGLLISDLRPSIEHQTVRHKYRVLKDDVELFTINVDLVKTWRPGRPTAAAYYADVDVAGMTLMDLDALTRLEEFVFALSEHNDLCPNHSTKTLRDIEELDNI